MTKRKAKEETAEIPLAVLDKIVNELASPARLTRSRRLDIAARLAVYKTIVLTRRLRPVGRPPVPGMHAAALIVHLLVSEHGALVKDAARVAAAADSSPGRKVNSSVLEKLYRTMKKADPDFSYLPGIERIIRKHLPSLAAKLSPVRSTRTKRKKISRD